MENTSKAVGCGMIIHHVLWAEIFIVLLAELLS